MLEYLLKYCWVRFFTIHGLLKGKNRKIMHCSNVNHYQMLFLRQIFSFRLKNDQSLVIYQYVRICNKLANFYGPASDNMRYSFGWHLTASQWLTWIYIDDLEQISLGVTRLTWHILRMIYCNQLYRRAR